MVSTELAAREQGVGLPPRTLYFRGRTAVLGDPPADVVAAVLGIFPTRVVEKSLVRGFPATRAIEAYLGACWDWARDAFSAADRPGRLADLGFAVADAADPSALPLFQGWRGANRPDDAAARLGHALMLLRELRGGLHFAALRAVGLTVAQAVALDPGGGRGRLRRTGWHPDEVDALVAAVEGRADLAARWREAERLTDERFEEALGVLGAGDREAFAAGLEALG